MTVIAPPDPAFPLLTDALNPARAGIAFAIALANAGHPTQSLTCQIERSRIKRGRKAVIGYRLRGRAANGAAIDQRAMVTLFPDGEASRMPDMSDGQILVEPAFGPPALQLEELGGQAFFFPNDRKVHQIAALLADQPGVCEIVHYVPEQGCTICVTQADGRVLYGKCRADDRGRVAARVYAAAQQAKGIRLAPVIAHDPKRRILWQEAAAGRPLDPTDVCARPAQWAGEIATALDAFHNVKPPSQLKRLTYESIVHTLSSRSARMEASLPGLASRILACSHQLAASKPEATTLSLAHGDLHPGNLLWNGASFALIDLDTAALAPRALDHGTLVAALVHKAIEANVRDAAIAIMIRTMRSAARDELGDVRAFDWCLAACLLGERLYRCTTRLKSPRPLVRERLLDRAERLVVPHV